jgi:oligopeptide transport system substrate-binding protein
LKDPSQVGVKATDDYTLEVRLRKPAAYFIYLTAICPSYPQRQDVVEKWKDHWTDPEHMVTNGPYKITKWAHEYKIELSSNPTFFEGEPRLKKIKMFMVSEPSTAFALYENDQLDFIDNRSFSTSDVERSKNSPEYKNFPLLRVNYIGFNNQKKPFDDARVRKAFSMAIDRRVFGALLKRNEMPSYCWIPPGMQGYSKDSEVKYDPEMAKQLLAEAGFPHGKNFPVVKMLFPGREDSQIVCEQLQDLWKRNLGVNVQLQNEELKVYFQTLHRNPPEVFRANWGADYPDPETFMNLFTSTSGNNYPRYKSTAYDALVDRASGDQNPTERTQLYAKADKLACVTDATIAPIFQATQNTMVKPWVKGLEFNACDIQFFKHVKIVNQ